MGAGRRYVPELDGLRAIAVGVVLGVHAGLPFTKAGWLGVDLFFVLSGFLITTLLLNEHSNTQKIALGRFWVRRILRLAPAYMLYAAGITIAMWSHPENLATYAGWTPAEYTASLWLYFVNHAPMGDVWTHQNYTMHLWSLAVEEQFYLVWPLILSLALRARGSARGLALALVTVQLGCFFFGTEQMRATHLFGRGLGISLGCLAAALAFSHARRVPALLPPWVAPASAGAMLVIFAVGSGLPMLHLAHEDGIRYWVLLPFCLLSALLTVRMWYGADAPPGIFIAALRLRFMVYVGKISYGVYLYHLLAQGAVWSIPGEWIGADQSRALAYAVRFFLYIAGSIGIAALSHRFVERPFLRLKAKQSALPT